MNWLRLYTTVLDNPKLQRLSGDDFKAVVNLWCLASIHNGTLPSVTDIAFRLRCTEVQAADLIDDLIDKRILDRTPNGVVPHDWSEHQYASDNSADRVRKFRKRQAEKDMKLPETLPKRSSNAVEQNRTEQIQNRAEQTHSVRAALPALRKPTADDMNGQTSPNFEQWFSLWMAVRGNAYRSQACGQYISVVLQTSERDAMECAASYVAGPGADPSHGYRPDNFLRDMAGDGFKTRWPAARAPDRKESVMEQAKRLAREKANGTR